MKTSNKAMLAALGVVLASAALSYAADAFFDHDVDTTAFMVGVALYIAFYARFSKDADR